MSDWDKDPKGNTQLIAETFREAGKVAQDHGDHVMGRKRLRDDRDSVRNVLLGQKVLPKLQPLPNLAVGRLGICLQGQALKAGCYTLNHGVIQTYLICHKSRRKIFNGSATMVSRKNIMTEYCSRLMRL